MPRVDEARCEGCGVCVPYCTVGAISMVGGLAVVDRDLCVECDVCVRKEVCPFEAFVVEDLDAGRALRHFLSDPTESKGAGQIPGRGTEEAKTNDVTGRVKRGEVGFAVDMGRPGVGVWMVDVQKVAMALAAAGLVFEAKTPLVGLLADPTTGQLKEEYLHEHLLSIIIEGKCRLADFPAVMAALREVAGRIDTVFSLGLISRVDEKGATPLLDEMARLGLPAPIRGKVNVGLGRPLVLD